MHGTWLKHTDAEAMLLTNSPIRVYKRQRYITDFLKPLVTSPYNNLADLTVIAAEGGWRVVEKLVQRFPTQIEKCQVNKATWKKETVDIRNNEKK